MSPKTYLRSVVGDDLQKSSDRARANAIGVYQMHEVLAETDLLETTTTNGTTTTNRTTCMERWTCSSCTEATMPLCSWLVSKQICVDNTAMKVQGQMVVTNGSSCPKFSVDNKVSALHDNNQIITVTVTVDDWDMSGGFVHLLANNSIVCQTNKNTYKAKMDGNRISCSWKLKLPPLNTTKCQHLVPHYTHFSIVFDGKLLRFDNVSNHYLVTYPWFDDCPKFKCSNCHWNNGTYRFFCNFCSVKNTTTSMDIKPYCDVRNISNLLYLNITNIRNYERCSSKRPDVMNYSVTPKIILQSDQPPESSSSQAGNNSSPVHPTLDDGQMFGGIKSGGTTFRVYGKHFYGLQNVKCCVNNRYWCGNCDVRNDTHMVCRSPKVDIKLKDAFENECMRFYAKNSSGLDYKLNLPDLNYHLYHDPVFAGFVFDGLYTVTVNGLYPDKVFAAEDLSIRLVGEVSSCSCQITSMDSTQIICKVSQLSLSQFGQLPKQLNVTVGDETKVVKPLKQKFSHLKSSLAQLLWPSVVTIGAYVSFIAFLCVAVVYLKATKDYDLMHLQGRQQLAEMQPLDERNPNDYDDNGEPDTMLLVRDEYH